MRVLVGQSATTLTAVSSTQIVGGTIIALALLLQLLTRLNGASVSALPTRTLSVSVVARLTPARLQLEGRGAALILLYVVGTVTLAIAAVGAYGAHRQSRVALIVVSPAGRAHASVNFSRREMSTWPLVRLRSSWCAWSSAR